MPSGSWFIQCAKEAGTGEGSSGWGAGSRAGTRPASPTATTGSHGATPRHRRQVRPQHPGGCPRGGKPELGVTRGPPPPHSWALWHPSPLSSQPRAGAFPSSSPRATAAPMGARGRDPQIPAARAPPVVPGGFDAKLGVGTLEPVLSFPIPQRWPARGSLGCPRDKALVVGGHRCRGRQLLPERKTCRHASPSPAACSHGSPAEDEPLCVPMAGIWGWSRDWEQACFLLPPLRAVSATWPRLGPKGRGRCPEAQAGCAVAQDSLLPCWNPGKNHCPQHPRDGGAGCVPRRHEHRAEGLRAGAAPRNPRP